jgi:hypothetical protein
VRVEKRKPEPGRHMGWDATELGTDGFGTWLFCPAGARHVGERGQVFVMPCDGVQLMPADGWWVAWWWAEPRWISVDLCSPPVREPDRWHYTDLDLDVARFADGTVHLLDEDEFQRTAAELPLEPEVVRRVTETADWALAALRDGGEPFAEVGWRWLEASRA